MVKEYSDMLSHSAQYWSVMDGWTDRTAITVSHCSLLCSHTRDKKTMTVTVHDNSS